MLFEEIVLFFLANRLTNQKELNFDFILSNLPSILNLIEYQSLPSPPIFIWLILKQKSRWKLCAIFLLSYSLCSHFCTKCRENSIDFLVWIICRLTDLDWSYYYSVILFIFFILFVKNKHLERCFVNLVYKLIQTHVGNLLLIFFFLFLFKFLIEKKKKPKKFKMIDSLVHASALYVFIELSGFPRNSDIFKTLFPRFRPFHFREHVLTWKKIVWVSTNWLVG
jgi:hypothetical protein